MDAKKYNRRKNLRRLNWELKQAEAAKVEETERFIDLMNFELQDSLDYEFQRFAAAAYDDIWSDLDSHDDCY